MIITRKVSESWVDLRRGWRTHTNSLAIRLGTRVHRAHLTCGARWQVGPAARARGQRRWRLERALPRRTAWDGPERAHVLVRALWALRTAEARRVIGRLRREDRGIDTAVGAAAAIGVDLDAVAILAAAVGAGLQAGAGQTTVGIAGIPPGAGRAARHRPAAGFAETAHARGAEVVRAAVHRRTVDRAARFEARVIGCHREARARAAGRASERAVVVAKARRLRHRAIPGVAVERGRREIRRARRRTACEQRGEDEEAHDPGCKAEAVPASNCLELIARVSAF